MKTPIRAVLTGPESTGKSTLIRQLSEALDIPSAPEYARIYLEEHGPHYDFDGLLDMSRRHLDYQAARVPSSVPVGLFDTDLINYRVWSEVVFGTCHPEILERSAREQHHVYLLCAPDIPWEPDPLREHPERREEIFERHREMIECHGRAYAVVEGDGEARLLCALQGVTHLTGTGGATA